MKSALTDYLVDTNLLVYAYDPADPRKQRRAIQVLDHLHATSAGAVSTQVLGEFFNTVTRKLAPPLTPAEAERRIATYALFWPVFDLTSSIVLEAVRGLQRHPMSYWDALIWATAKLNGVPEVLSEDFNDGASIEGVRFRNPFRVGFDIATL